MESFGGRLRDELLAVEAFTSLLEAQVLVQDWRIEYNTTRPHSALGYLTPTDYAKTWTITHPALSERVDQQPGPGQGSYPPTSPEPVGRQTAPLRS